MAALPEDTGSRITPLPGNPRPSSGIPGHMQSTVIHADKTCIHTEQK